MKFSIFAAAALGSCTALAKTITSKPFKLVLEHTASNYSGYRLETCHEGAAIEGLCPSKDSSVTPANYSTFTFTYDNYTTLYPVAPSGQIIFDFPYNGGSQKEKQTLGLYLDPSTNVGLAMFGLGDTALQYMSFDVNNYLFIGSSLNDTALPISSNYNETYYYRWYVCEANFEGYVYPSLNWVYGKYPPENPTCLWTMVKRVFV